MSDTQTMTEPKVEPAAPEYRYMGAVALDEFSHVASVGSRVEYYRGFMARDLEPTLKNYYLPERLAASETRATAWLLATRGKVLLTQQRHGPDDYSYFATKAAR